MRHQTALVRREGKTQDEDLTKIVRARFNQSADLSTYPRKIFVRTTRATASLRLSATRWEMRSARAEWQIAQARPTRVFGEGNYRALLPGYVAIGFVPRLEVGGDGLEGARIALAGSSNQNLGGESGVVGHQRRRVGARDEGGQQRRAV